MDRQTAQIISIALGMAIMYILLSGNVKKIRVVEETESHPSHNSKEGSKIIDFAS